MSQRGGSGGQIRCGLVWAQARHGAIGRDGTMPWHLPEDLAHFRAITTGAPVVMGRRTWESLPEKFRPLPGRTNVVVSRRADYAAPGAIVTDSLERAIERAAGVAQTEPGQSRRPEPAMVWVIGGGELYRQAMPFASDLVVTQIELDVPDADTFAPEIDSGWHLTSTSERAISRTGVEYYFERYRRMSEASDTLDE